MTLLEATIAFVLLSVVGIVCLDQSRAATQLEVSSVEWRQAVARADAALADAALDGAALSDVSANASGRDNVRVSRRAWRGRVDVIEVTVPLSSGGVYTSSRLVERAMANVGGAR